jgi:putative ABC transport system substrate-binding protein
MKVIPLVVALILRLALAALTGPLAAEAQQPGKPPKIGFLGGGREDGQHLWDAFREGLRERGYVEGQNIVIDWKFSRGRDELFPSLAAELVSQGVDVIVVGGGRAIHAARNATSTIPIVLAVSADPVGAGLVASLARPGGNVTGLSILAVEAAGKRLELLKEVVPRASRVAVLWNVTYPGKAQEWRETQAAARALGLTLQSAEVRDPGDLDKALSDVARGRPDALVAFSETMLLRHRRRVIDFANKHRLPLVSETSEFADAGALLTYGASLPDLFRRAATYVDRILKGAKPADLPVEQPSKFELVVNIKTARALGLTIPPSLRLRADRIID